MNDQSTLRTFRAAVDTLQSAVTFRAWVNNREITDCKALAEAQTFEDAIAAVQLWASHKDTVSILCDDAGKRAKHLQIYSIKQESQRKWRRDPVTGETVAYRKQYPAMVVAMPVDAFEPTRPFCAFRDDPVGVDRSLVVVQ